MVPSDLPPVDEAKRKAAQEPTEDFMVTTNVNGVNGIELPHFDGKSIGEIREYLDRMREHAFIVGGLLLQQIPSMHKVVAEMIYVNPEDPGTVYPTGKDDKNNPQPVWSLTNATLKKLGRAASISWDSVQSRRLDDGKNPDVVRFGKVCRVRELDGSMRTIEETYMLDLAARADEIYEAKREQWYWKCGEGQLRAVEKRIRENAENAKRNNGRPWSDGFCQKLLSEVDVHPESEREPWAREQARIDMIQKRKYAEQLAATGAESRCIIAALAIQRGGYYFNDLKTKPFIILKLVPDIDYANDPQARMMLVAMHSGFVDAAFGHGQSLGGFIAAPAVERPQIAGAAPQVIPVPAEMPVQAADVAETAEIEVEINMQDGAPDVPDPDVPVYSEPEIFDAATGAPAAHTRRPGVNPTEAEFVDWPRADQIALLKKLQAEHPPMPKIDIEGSKDAGLVRYYGVALKYIKAAAGR